jgi:hypothetical protein
MWLKCYSEALISNPSITTVPRKSIFSVLLFSSPFIYSLLNIITNTTFGREHYGLKLIPAHNSYIAAISPSVVVIKVI